tara:strand:- start:354 stop:500 length:147 start_codon:yes stop_codon:yes gene_type:complete
MVLAEKRMKICQLIMVNFQPCMMMDTYEIFYETKSGRELTGRLFWWID